MENNSAHTRRDFVKLTALGVIGTIPLINSANSFFESDFFDASELDISIFSKHLQFLDYKTSGEMAAEMGFSGVDLTVRPKGHVLPELVKTDLPKAIKAIKEAGSNCKMITTTIESITNPIDVDIITTAASLGVNYYRSNWFKFKEGKTMIESLDTYQNEIYQLSELNKSLGIVGCYQNHAGRHVGSSFWEIDTILKTANPNYFGTQYDIRHAMVEGGNSWINGFELLKSKIKTIVLKDFKWAKVNEKWEPINVPIGEGMVDFSSYFKLLKKYQLKPDVCLHVEYDLGGAEKGNSTITVDKKVVFDAMKKDRMAIQKLWKEA
ncbi:sugar phosphate isomerase/epimerase family protein [Flavobacterium nackdongense]|uniref:Sugar phosphate isomerase/epimerase n=1 Tax=Flavobacterium nackdongense TaxID=2547394 RepID=A0A4P6Y5M7_9FLAO|nr:sugar phosphate isomerase/epimerase family protein [Flavobacterium nackdongense]QBN17449.1 sugar phosphate isomerase/epimerase [Flavobacterium nackdongense]